MINDKNPDNINCDDILAVIKTYQNPKPAKVSDKKARWAMDFLQGATCVTLDLTTFRRFLSLFPTLANDLTECDLATDARVQYALVNAFNAIKEKTYESLGDRTGKPLLVFRSGSIEICVWENFSEKGVFHKTTINKSYSEDGEWKTTKSLDTNDLPVVSKLLDRVFEVLINKKPC